MIIKNINLCVAIAMLAGSQLCFAQSAELDELRKLYQSQQQRLEQQSQLLQKQQKYLLSLDDRFEKLAQSTLQNSRGTGSKGTGVNGTGNNAQVAQNSSGSRQQQTSGKIQPVGQEQKRQGAKPTDEEIASIESISQGAQGILTPKGTLTIEPSVKYSHTSSNRVFLEGFGPLVLPSLFLGLIDIREVDRDVYTASLTARYGLTNRMQVEARVPYIYREDETRSRSLLNLSDGVFVADGNGLGDTELALDYQFNDGTNGWPFFTGSIRASIPTGTDPFEVDTRDATIIDNDGNPQAIKYPTELATGTGFYGLQPSLTFIYPTDPAVFFGTVSYGWNIEDTKKIDGIKHDIDPGDSFGLSGGMGFGINDRASFSLGFSFKHLFKTKSDGTELIGSDADVGRLLLGYSLRLNKKTNINLSIGIGATDDAPDFEMGLRLPITVLE